MPEHTKGEHEVLTVEQRLRLAERVCALVGWTAHGSSDRDKALTEVWMEWAHACPNMTTREAWPDLDDAGIKALADRRDATRDATLARLTAPAEPCRQCGPGYRIGDDGCRHTSPGVTADGAS